MAFVKVTFAAGRCIFATQGRHCGMHVCPLKRCQRPLTGKTLWAIFGDGSMLQFFRNFFSSKLGVGITIGMLVAITVAFAGADVASSGGFGGVAGGDRIATVGKRRIST